MWPSETTFAFNSCFSKPWKLLPPVCMQLPLEEQSACTVLSTEFEAWGVVS